MPGQAQSADRPPPLFEGCCPACALALRVPVVYRQGDLPVQSCVQPSSSAAATEIARRPLELVHCTGCGLVFNRAFDPLTQMFDGGYEETQAFSPVFRAFADHLVDVLIDRWRPKGTTVVEIGCGKGDFLEALCRQGGCNGIGIDPAFDPGRRPPTLGVTFERRLFSAADVGRRADFLICRHTLEHVGPIREFLRDVVMFCRAGGVREVFFEVPDAGRIVNEGAFWDVYYEHANYFSARAFEAAFRRAGMTVTDRLKLFHEQYLGLFAYPDSNSDSDSDSDSGMQPAAARVEHDAWAALEHERAAWRQRIEQCPGPVVIWGSGSKGVAFLAGSDPQRRVAAAVDINPHRQGRFMPGTGQPILAPEALADLQPATVVIMNPAYEEEIGEQLERLGLNPRIHVVGKARRDPRCR